MSLEYRQSLRLRAEHVDCFRRLRISALMRLFQAACIAHTEALGMGREKTLDRGFLWVVNSETMEMTRLPEYDEQITLVCRPGKTMHFFFPRQMTVLDAEGNAILRVGALWSLIDRQERRMIDPSEHGIVIAGEDRPEDVMPPLALPMRQPAKERSLQADYSIVDINGHVNNAAYADAAFDLLPVEILQKADVAAVRCVFKKELPLGGQTLLQYGSLKQGFFVQCDHFSMEIAYA